MKIKQINKEFLQRVLLITKLFIDKKINYKAYVDILMPYSNSNLENPLDNDDYNLYVTYWISMDADISEIRSGKVFTEKDWQDTLIYIENKFIPVVNSLIQKYTQK